MIERGHGLRRPKSRQASTSSGHVRERGSAVAREPAHPSRFTGEAPTRFGNWDLVAPCLLAVVLALADVADWDIFIFRPILGLGLGLLLPGLFLTLALFPDNSALSGMERLGLGLVLSVVLLVVPALALSEIRIRSSPATLSAVVAVDMCLLAAMIALRRRAVEPRRRYLIRVPASKSAIMLYVFAFAVIAATWGITARNLTAAQPQLWISGPHGRLSGYPFQVPKGSRNTSLTLHLDNPTPETRTYVLCELAGSHLRAPLRRVTVKPNTSWSMLFRLPTDLPLGPVKLSFELGCDNQRDTAGRLRVWVYYTIIP